MTYLLTGDDTAAKDLRITELKAKALGSEDTLSFDYDSLSGEKLSSYVFKKTLMSLPAIAKKRFVIVRAIHKLSPQNKQILLDFLGNHYDHITLVLETQESDARSSFMKQLSALAKASLFQKEIKKNVFDMTRAMGSHHTTEALKILSGLFLDGNHPLQIMGGLVWFWGKTRERISVESFQLGLKKLQEADLNIKRSRLNPEYAVEKLVVELSQLLAY